MCNVYTKPIPCSAWLQEETLTGGEQPGPVEALKNMLFSMQSVQASTARLANGVGSDDDSEDEQVHFVHVHDYM